MRKIKFKAWDSNRKIMYSAEELGKDELTLNPDGRGFVNVSSINPKSSQYMNHMIPLQFTGLTDRNGKEIYDGDILFNQRWFDFTNGETKTYKLVENECWFFAPFNEMLDARDSYMLISAIKEFVVAGNKYQNPELLKKTKGDD